MSAPASRGCALFLRQVLRSVGGLIIVSGAIITVVGCQPAKHNQGASLPPLDVAKLQRVGFDLVNAYVFQPYCISCHNGQHRPNLSNYALISKQIGAIENRCFTTTNPKRLMPKGRKGGLPTESAQLLKLWIDQGAPDAPARVIHEQNNSGGSQPAGGGPNKFVTFQQVFKQVIQRNCTPCHKPQNKWKLKDYNDINAVRKQIRGILLTTTLDYMPPKKHPPKPPLPKHWMENLAATPGVNEKALSESQLELLREWVLSGMPK